METPKAELMIWRGVGSDGRGIEEWHNSGKRVDLQAVVIAVEGCSCGWRAEVEKEKRRERERKERRRMEGMARRREVDFQGGFLAGFLWCDDDNGAICGYYVM